MFNSFKNKTTTNTSIIPVHVLKLISYTIDLSLSIIINESLLDGILPDNLQIIIKGNSNF